MKPINSIKVLEEILSNSNPNDKEQDWKVNSVLSDYNVKSEAEFERLLNDDTWHLCKCFYCKKTISLLNCNFHFDNPVCEKCI